MKRHAPGGDAEVGPPDAAPAGGAAHLWAPAAAAAGVGGAWAPAAEAVAADDEAAFAAFFEMADVPEPAPPPPPVLAAAVVGLAAFGGMAAAHNDSDDEDLAAAHADADGDPGGAGAADAAIAAAGGGAVPEGGGAPDLPDAAALAGAPALSPLRLAEAAKIAVANRSSIRYGQTFLSQGTSNRDADALLCTTADLFNTSVSAAGVPIKKLPITARTVTRHVIHTVSTAYGLPEGEYPIISTPVPPLPGGAAAPREWTGLTADMRHVSHVITQVLLHPDVSWADLFKDPHETEASNLSGGRPVVAGEPYFSPAAREISLPLHEHYTLLGLDSDILIVPIGVFNDACAVDSKRTESLNAVFVTLYCLPAWLRNRKFGMALLGFLPDLSLEKSAENARKQMYADQELLRVSVWEPLSRLHYEPFYVEGIRGKEGPVLVVPYFFAAMADMVGKADLLGVRGNACGTCLVPPASLGVFHPPGEGAGHPFRTVADVVNAVEDRARHPPALSVHDPVVRAQQVEADAEIARLVVFNVMVRRGWLGLREGGREGVCSPSQSPPSSFFLSPLLLQPPPPPHPTPPPLFSFLQPGHADLVKVLGVRGLYGAFHFDILHILGCNGLTVRLINALILALKHAAGAGGGADGSAAVRKARLAARIAACASYYNGYRQSHRRFPKGLKKLGKIPGRDCVTFCLFLAHCIGEDNQIFNQEWARNFVMALEAVFKLNTQTRAPQLGEKEIKEIEDTVYE